MHVLALFEFNISQKCIISAFFKVQVVFGDPDLGQSASLSLASRPRRPGLSLNQLSKSILFPCDWNNYLKTLKLKVKNFFCRPNAKNLHLYSDSFDMISDHKTVKRLIFKLLIYTTMNYTVSKIHCLT